MATGDSVAGMTDHLFEHIRKLAALMADQASKAYPDDLDAQIAMVRGAGKLASSLTIAKKDQDDHASRPRL